MKVYIKIISVVLLFLTMQKVVAQDAKRELTKKEKKSIILSIQTHLNAAYVNLETSHNMVNELERNLKSNKYNHITNPSEFSKVLTIDLQKISKDLHLKVNFEPKKIAQKKHVVSEKEQLKMEKMMEAKMAEINYGFLETKILTGNIGYLNLLLFADTKYAKETTTAAMNFLCNTNAIIIDLRSNKGGVPSMVQLLSSYFFDKSPVLLSDFYERNTNTKTQLYTLTDVDGKRSTNKPIYILTSRNTFSAAEAFSYTLKHYNKATIVGEVTKGGANRNKRFDINNEFTISIPYIATIHPITKTSWEGKGVQPNIKTTKKDAFIIAYIDAINKTVKRKKNQLFNKIGYTLLKEKSFDDAIKVFQENVKLFPNDANLWDSLGEAYFINHDNESALKSYTKALELDPNLESSKEMVQKLSTQNKMK
ncbi:S41 family peptidase [Tenacibaculum sp.]|uniref:S41 family peptidase n=1 Tax=Tenacibaculum sp. TaxID=1906242 RepID=UPI003D134AFF